MTAPGPAPDPSPDLAIVGGGLAGGLLALALAGLRPDLSVLLIDSGERLGGNHVWSFFGSDIQPDHRWLVDPLVCHGWAGHEVAFAGHRRVLPGAYYSIESERLDAVVRARLPAGRLLTGVAVEGVTSTLVRLGDGRTLAAGGVIDARGAGDLGALHLGWQKFHGRLLRLAAPHGLARPLIMDASVDQADGYRFVYVLPFGPDRLFVEDTYYSESADLDEAVLAERIDAYAAGRGWRGAAVERAESGVLPVCMGGDFDAYWRGDGAAVARIGVRGGFFHAMTGYSLADAVRVAHAIAALDDLSGPALAASVRAMADRHWRGQAFYRLLARMLFRAADPSERHHVLARFYRLPVALIDRFYAGRSTLYDKLRVLAGKPPVPLGRAIAALGAQDT